MQNVVFKKSNNVMLAALLAAMLNGCMLDSSDGNGTGTLNLGIKDAPVDGAEHVYVSVKSVAIHSAKNEDVLFEFDPAEKIDLLDYQDESRFMLLDNEEMAAGDYQWVRLDVATEGDQDSYIVINGAEYELTIPSEAQSGLKLVSGFTMPANGSTDFTIDFDLRKSVTQTQQGQTVEYKLRPALRLVDSVEVGNISGTVSSTLLSDAACTSGNFVYVYEGAGTETKDISGTSTDPVLTVPVKLNQNQEYEYKASYLMAGEYTVALTCQGNDDNPETMEDIVFSEAADVTVEAKSTATQNFE
jgi:hypothetical protein